MEALVCVSDERRKEKIKSDIKTKKKVHKVTFINDYQSFKNYKSKASVEYIVLDNIFGEQLTYGLLPSIEKEYKNVKSVVYFPYKQKKLNIPGSKIIICYSMDEYESWLKYGTKEKVENTCNLEEMATSNEELIKLKQQKQINQKKCIHPKKEKTTSKTNSIKELNETEQIAERTSNTPLDKDNRKISPNSGENEQFKEKVIHLRNEIGIPYWKQKIINHKSIALWSPLHRIGVTTLTVNFALFLSSFHISLAVLEGVTTNPKLRGLLEDFDRIPENWTSYASFLINDIDASRVVWNYQDIHWFPFEHDEAPDWDPLLLQTYLTGLKFHDLTLIDLPTGKMKAYTWDALEYIDEIWIVVNDDVQTTQEWKDYIMKVKERTHQCKLVFNQYFSFSQANKLAKTLGIELITKFPAVYEQAALNQYQEYPIIANKKVKKEWMTAFINLGEYCLGKKAMNQMETSWIKKMRFKYKLWKMRLL